MRTYSISGDNQSVGSALTAVFMNPAAGGAAVPGFEILRCWVSQRGSATSGQAGIGLGTQVSVFPSVVSATPQKISGMSLPTASLTGVTGVCAAGNCGITASGEGGGALTVKIPDSFNVLNGWLWVPTINDTLTFLPGGTSGFSMKFTAAPTPTTGWSYGVLYREIG